MLVDSHCHLDFDEFASDLEQVIERAAINNVKRLVTISTRISHFDRISALAEKHENVFCSVGTHPHYAHEESGFTVEELVKLARHPKAVALGETGLDYYCDALTSDIQKKQFRLHIEASRQTGLPLIIHSRHADEEMEHILREESRRGFFAFILHCYSSGMKLAQAGIELGGYLSFSGILTFKNAPDIRNIAKIVPQNRLLVETDSPYLSPVPYRGQRNEPAFVIKTAEMLAQLLDISNELIAKITTQNALQIFSKMTAPAGE